MRDDLNSILANWPYNPDSTVRKILGEDGREKLQVRVSQGPWDGVLQMEMDGRPDGRRPHGFDFALDYQKDRLEKHRAARETDDGFKLDGKACAELFDESTKVYGRYVMLLNIQDFERVARDTERNMEVFRFVNRYAEDEDNRMSLEKWWPYILRINGTAKAMIALKKKDYERALGIVQETRRRIEDLEELDAEEFRLERERSREGLEAMENSIKQMRGKTESEILKEQMDEAVAKEEFEQAAKLRDQLRQLRRQ